MMRSAAVILATAALAAQPAAAQSFEGTISMRARNQGSPDIALEMQVKGKRTVVATTLGPETGPMAGGEVRIINDGVRGEMVMLMPVPPGMPLPGAAGAKGIKVVMKAGDLEKQAAGTPEPVITKLGTSQEIAGMQCDDYSIRLGNDLSYMCATEAMGSISLPLGADGQVPAWARVLGDRPFFPLKVWGEGMSMEVTRVARGSVPDSAFSYEGNYLDMSSQMGPMLMRGGNR